MALMARKRAAWLVRATALGVLVLGVPAGVAVAHLTSTERAAVHSPPVRNGKSGRTNRGPVNADQHDSHLSRLGPAVKAGPGLQALHAAVSKTLAVSNYDLTFTLSETGQPSHSDASGPASNFSGGPTTGVSGVRSKTTSAAAGATGSGVADLDPQALSVMTYPSCWKSGVSLRIDGANVFELLQVTDPTHPPPAGVFGGGQDLESFQSTVTSCLGTELGALATIGMCSPSGQLASSEQAITGAKPVGTVTVNGEPAEEYGVTIDPAGFLEQPNSTPDENTAIEGALAVIGSNPMSAIVDVDNAGYIVEMDLSVSYADGLTATHTIDLSNFGDAGTIVMPPARPSQPAQSVVGGKGCVLSAPCPPSPVLSPPGVVKPAVAS